MKAQKFVYAEVMNGITDEMRKDSLVAIISDGSVFIITTEENSKKYDNEEFFPTEEETIMEYNEMYPNEVSKLIK